MTNPAHEKLVEEVAKALCETRTWPGAWIRANEVEMAACRNDACVALATVAKALETVTPEMVEAWKQAQPDEEPEETSDRQGYPIFSGRQYAIADWRAMLAASALGKGEHTAAKKETP